MPITKLYNDNNEFLTNQTDRLKESRRYLTPRNVISDIDRSRAARTRKRLRMLASAILRSLGLFLVIIIFFFFFFSVWKQHEDSPRYWRFETASNSWARNWLAAIRVDSRLLRIVNHVLQRKLLLYIWPVQRSRSMIRSEKSFSTRSSYVSA